MKINKQTTTEKLVYDNIRMIHPDGTQMCFCSKKRADWYINRELAELDGINLLLKFIPNGYGDPLDINESRLNVCVMTGETKQLTKHHIIPTQYRKHFKIHYKDKNSTDIALLTREAHNQYEVIASDFKAKLYKDLVQNDSEYEKYLGWCEFKMKSNTLEKYTSLIPPSKQVYMMMRIEGLKDKWDFTDLDLNLKIKFESDSSKKLVEILGEEYLIILWKLHFLKYAKPNMPSWWKPNMIKIIKKGESKNKTEMFYFNINNDSYLCSLINKYKLTETANKYCI